MFLKHEEHGLRSGRIHLIDRLAYFPVLISFQGIACVAAYFPVQISSVQGKPVLQFPPVAIRSVSPRPAVSFLFGCPFSWLLQWHRFLISPSVHLSIQHYTGFLQESYSENQQTIGGFPLKTDNKNGPPSHPQQPAIIPIYINPLQNFSLDHCQGLQPPLNFLCDKTVYMPKRINGFYAVYPLNFPSPSVNSPLPSVERPKNGAKIGRFLLDFGLVFSPKTTIYCGLISYFPFKPQFRICITTSTCVE